MFPYDPSEWSDLFVGVAGASAALTGLLFVAVSINIERILKLPGLPDRALATLLMLLGVLVASILGLAPGQSRTAVGAELIGVGLAMTAGVGVLTWLSRGREAPTSSFVARLIVAGAGTIPFVIGGASLLLECGGGLYWILAGTVLAITGAVLNAWVLLVEILR